MVLLVWTDGEVRIPVGYRVWHKGGLSKVDLASELLSHARNRLKSKPQFVLFDSWYPATRLLKRLQDYGWYFVCQLKKSCHFGGVALHAYRPHPYWHAIGHLSGGLKVLVVQHRRKYYVTNRLTLTAQEVEEVIRVWKSQLSLEACQAGYKRRGADPARSRRPKSITSRCVWWPTWWWNASASITECLGEKSSGVSSSKAHRSHCQRWSG